MGLLFRGKDGSKSFLFFVVEQVGDDHMSKSYWLYKHRGPIEPITFLNKEVGTVSRKLEDVFILLTSLVSSCIEIGEKFSQDCWLGRNDKGRMFDWMQFIFQSNKEGEKLINWKKWNSTWCRSDNVTDGVKQD